MVCDHPLTVWTEKKIDPFLTLHLRRHFRYTRSLNVKYRTIEALEENTSEFLIPLCVETGFLTLIQNSETVKEKIHKFDRLKWRKDFCTANTPWTVVTATLGPREDRSGDKNQHAENVGGERYENPGSLMTSSSHLITAGFHHLLELLVVWNNKCPLI